MAPILNQPTASPQLRTLASPIRQSTGNSHIFENKSSYVDGVKSRPKSELGDQTFELDREDLNKLLGPISDEWKTKVIVPPKGGIWADEASFLKWANECAKASTEAPVYCKITATTVISSPDGSTRRKPDLAILRPLGPLATHLRNKLLAPSERQKLLENVSWKEVYITGYFIKRRKEARKEASEVNSSTLEEPLNSNSKSSNTRSLHSGSASIKPIDHLSEAAYHLLRFQPNRQHTIHFEVNNSQVCLLVFNQSGRFKLGPFDLDHDPHTCQWIFHRLPRLALAELGFIEMLAPLADFGRELKWGSFIGNVKEELHKTRSIASRATATYRVEGTYDGAPFNGVVKFAWVDMHREFTELEALDIIREKGTHAALVRPPSARPTSSDAPSSQLPAFLTTSFIGEDETLRLWLEKHPGFVPRKLSVVFLSPVAKPIQHYGSVQHLLQAFIDAVEAHKWLCNTAKILHRDISMGNVMLQAGNRAEGTRGLLIDLDLSVQCEQNKRRSSANHRTGTFPFIAVDLLRDETREHLPRHDLESFFYVLVWICTFYGPPASVSDATSGFEVCEKPAPQLDKSKVTILTWQTSSAIGLKEALLGGTWDTVISQIDPFWEPLVEAGVFEGLRELLSPTWRSTRAKLDLKHDSFLEVLKAGLTDHQT